MADTLEKIDANSVKRTFVDTRTETLNIDDVKQQILDLTQRKKASMAVCDSIQKRIDDLKAVLVTANTTLGMTNAVDPTI